MIVSHTHQFIFVHLHKTAGTSVMEALAPLLSGDDFLISTAQQDSLRGAPVPEKLNLHKHSSALRISRSVGVEIWRSYFKFAFVRHPFDRLVSLYEFLHRVRRNHTQQSNWLKRLLSLTKEHPWETSPDDPPWSWLEMQALLKSTDFSEFIRSEQLANAQGGKPQARSLTNRKGELMIDFVGKVENIAEDWQTLCEKLKIKCTLPRSNSSARQFQDVREYWNHDDAQFAASKYRQDFEMFGYSATGFGTPR